MSHRNNQNDRRLERALARWEASTTKTPQAPTGSTLQHVLAAGMSSMFSNAHNARITGGSFNITTNISTVNGLSLKLLYDRVALNAILNAGGRPDEVRCHPGTREEVIGRIEKWGDSPTAHIFWLSGPAGAGKSAIMQTIAERCEERGVPHANFFFFREDSSRRTVSPLVTTLLYQIILIYPSLRDPVATMLDNNPLLLDSPLENQLMELIVAPLRSIQQLASPYHRPMLLLDGLDECNSESKRIQQQILHAFDKVLSQLPGLFCLLVASRDESQIKAAFHRVSSPCLRLYLDNQYFPGNDIRVFVTAQFEEVRNTHSSAHTLDTTWPPLEDVNYVVEMSSGLFIIAATVMRFILESSASPTLSLGRVKGAARLASKLPFSHPDTISYILSQVDDQDELKEILHAELLKETPTADEPGLNHPDHPGGVVNTGEKSNDTARPNLKATPSHDAIRRAILQLAHGSADVHPSTPAHSPTPVFLDPDTTRLPKPDITDSHWIWTNEQPYDEPPGGPRAFRKAVVLPPGRSVDSMVIDITCDNFYTLYVNGNIVGNGTDWGVVERYSIKFPRTDSIVIAVYASNDPIYLQQAGLIASAVMWDSTQSDARPFYICTDSSWKTSITATASDFEMTSYRLDSSWTGCRVEGPYGIAPWGPVKKPTTTNPITGGFSGLDGVADPPSAPLATPGPDMDGKTTVRRVPNIGDSQWIWTNEQPYDEPPGGPRAFRKVVNLPPGQYVDSMIIDITCDNYYTLYVNGNLVGNGTDWWITERYSIRFPRTNWVVVAVYASNDTISPQQAGLIASAVMLDSTNADGRTFDIGTDSTWKTSITAAGSGFERTSYRLDSSWTGCRVEGPYGMAPWGPVKKPTTTNPVVGGFSGLIGIADPPSAPLATPGPA